MAGLPILPGCRLFLARCDRPPLRLALSSGRLCDGRHHCRYLEFRGFGLFIALRGPVRRGAIGPAP